jgi:hypothetical protein
MGQLEPAHFHAAAVPPSHLPVLVASSLPPFLSHFYDQGCRLTDGAAIRTGGMDMSEHRATLDIQVAVGLDGDAEEVAQATLQLRREFLDLDVDAVEVPRTGEAPPGSRAVDLAALGALAINIGETQLLTAVIAAIRSWLTASSRRSIKLELGGDVLELTSVSSSEQRRLTDEWLNRHTSR